MTIKGCKSIAEYAMRRWMADHNFVSGYFTLEVTGNEGIITDKTGESIKLVYDTSDKCVYTK